MSPKEKDWIKIATFLFLIAAFFGIKEWKDIPHGFWTSKNSTLEQHIPTDPVPTSSPLSTTAVEHPPTTVASSRQGVNDPVQESSPPVSSKQKYFKNSVDIEMVWIDAGSFIMGSPVEEEDRNKGDEEQRRITISRGFWLGKYEVTQNEYSAVMGTNPSFFKGVGGRAPVDSLTRAMAEEFCIKLTGLEKNAGRLPVGFHYSIPSEAQWEYACRAGTQTTFAVGNGQFLTTDQANFNGADSCPCSGSSEGTNFKRTVPVGSYQPNAWGAL